MGDHKFHSAGYGSSSQSPYSPYNSNINSQQQQMHQSLPSPQTPGMHPQNHDQSFGGRLPSMAVPQQNTQPTQFSPQNAYQPQMPQRQYQYAHQPSQYQQPSPYSHNQQPYSPTVQSYPSMLLPPVVSPHQVVQPSQSSTYRPSGSYGPAQPQSPRPSSVPDDNAPVRLEDEEAFRTENPPPSPEHHMYQDCVWSLQVVQEPKRARMCGHGDKDRRPITCPPIVKLTITDIGTGSEIDYNNTSITIGHLTCVATLSGVHGNDDKSVLKQHPQQQTISACSIGGYPTALAPQNPEEVAPRIDPGQYRAAPYSQNGYLGNRNPSQSLFPPMDRPPTWNKQHAIMSGPAPTPYGQPPPRPGSQLPPFHPAAIRPQQPPTPPADSSREVTAGSVFARNLIGSTSSSAHLLHDGSKRYGIYFIFSDLSVRMEDWFRLKFQVFNVAECLKGLSEEEIQQRAAERDAAPSETLEGKRGSKSMEGIRNSLVGSTAPCLATCWTQCFRVYSAKRFPGVAESTALSKVFAKQGVKISVRKDAADKNMDKNAGDKRKRGGDDDGEGDDDEDVEVEDD